MKKIMLIVLITILIVFFVVSYNNISADAVQAETVQVQKRPCVVIDCGHGGEDGGAVSQNGLLEKDVNLQIGLSLEKMMIHSGFNVVMIRTKDESVADKDAISLREKKVSDLHNRASIINSDSENILISIHQNMYDDSRYFGAQVFYSANNSKSKELAESVRVALKGLLQKNNERQCKSDSGSIYILKNSQVPAILVECGFLSNAIEENKLSTEEYRNQLAFSIFAGFLEYYYQNY